jgi:hypothetical protein
LSECQLRPSASSCDRERSRGVRGCAQRRQGRARWPESASGGDTEAARSTVHGMRPSRGEDLASNDVPRGWRRLVFSSRSSPASRAAAPPHSPELPATSFSRDLQPPRGGGAPAPSGAGEERASQPTKLSIVGLSLSLCRACRTSSLSE